jgi:predicted nucleic acid-binding protein
MRRAVIDTNLYIDWLNAGRHEDVLFRRDAVKYLSAVVMLELYAGAVPSGPTGCPQRGLGVRSSWPSARAFTGSVRGRRACAAGASAFWIPGGEIRLARE